MSENEPVWYEPADPTPRHPCPCCDYVTLPERGNYLICPVCFWEDDGVDIDEPGAYSGPNHMTLQKGRENFRRFGACAKAMVKNVLPAEGRARFRYEPRQLGSPDDSRS
jgi:hypothetical protein